MSTRPATVARYGYGNWLGIVRGKGRQPRTPDLAAGLALGDYLADAA